MPESTRCGRQLRVQPDQSFSVVAWTAPIIFMAVIGGLGTIEGPIIGAFAYWFFADRFSNNPAWYFIVLGGLAVVIALFLKRGVWGTLRRWVDVQLFPLRHHLE
jgi:branched-chain amino acid transport system permease protein